MEKEEFSTQDKRFIEENSNVEIICRIKKNKKEMLQSRIPEISSARRPKSRRPRSKSKKWNSSINTSVTKTPKRSRSKSTMKRISTPKARSKSSKCSIFCSKDYPETVIASENPISTKIVETSTIDKEDLGPFSSPLLEGAHSFNFDKVFTGDRTNLNRFYNKAVKPYTKNLIKGKNSTIILFGPSFSGKSFIVTGIQPNSDKGVISCAVDDIFEYIDMSNEAGDPLILKMSSYIVYLEKICDMLSPKKSGAKLDHFLSASKEEVISKITNLKEKIVPNKREFKSILGEISRNKKLYTAMLKSHTRFDKNCHLIISLRLDRKIGSKFKKFSQMNFAELCGSEQAVSEVETSFIQDCEYPGITMKEFATQSFNSLSANLLKTALKGKIKSESQKSESMLTKCLSETMTYKSNILLICAVSPLSTYFNHSLPALKFCYKIRQCINKNLIKLRQKKLKKLMMTNESAKRQLEDSTLSQGEFFNSFTTHLVKRMDQLSQELADKNFIQGNVSQNFSDDSEFKEWYRNKMKEITSIMDELIKESQIRSQNEELEAFIKARSDDCVMMKKDLDRIRDLYYSEQRPSPDRSPETIGSAKYFTTNSENETEKPGLIHEYGVLKRNSNTGSTPSFKPYPGSNYKQPPENLLQQPSSPVGNKFDELEARLVSLENTLDGKPSDPTNYSQREYNSSPRSYNPFSPPKDSMYIQEEEVARDSSGNIYKRPSNYTGEQRDSPIYVDSSAEQMDLTPAHTYSTGGDASKLSQLERLLQETEQRCTRLESDLRSKVQESENFKNDFMRKNSEYEQIYHKFVTQEKENERLKTTYEVVCQQEMEKQKKNVLNLEEKEAQISTLTVKNQEISDEKESLKRELKDAQANVDRLQLDKESLEKIINSANYEQKIKTLEEDLRHHKGLLDNERRSRQSVTDSISKKDLHLEDLERINYELSSKLEERNSTIKRNEEETNHLKFRIQDLSKENDGLKKDLTEQNERIKELERDLAHCGQCYDSLDKEMSVLKAKEYDRIGNSKTILEKDKQIRTLEYENECMQKEIEKAKGLEEELQYFKDNQDKNFKLFEDKFEEISKELIEMQNENNGLRIREGNLREKVKALIKDKDDLLRKIHDTENIDTTNRDRHLSEIEGMLKNLTFKSTRDSHEDLRKSLAEHSDKERKVEVIHDLQERIQKFKDDYNRKRSQKDHFINE